MKAESSQFGRPNRSLPRAKEARWPLERWCMTTALSSVPVAAAPVAFSLVALSMTGDLRDGATMVLAMTVASVVAAVPLTRVGARFAPITVFRWLVLVRVIGLLALTLAIAAKAPFLYIVAFSALVGSVHGAVHGVLRALLSGIVAQSRLPRALGIAATLNEVVFVLSPVLASVLGGISVVFALAVVTVLSLLPMLLAPTPRREAPRQMAEPSRVALRFRPVLPWLACSAASGFTVAVIEIGAVALALFYGHEATMAVLFTVPLCLASVTGGVWVSLRNRALTRGGIVAALAVMMLGSAFAGGDSLALTIMGTVLIGLVLAPLGTSFSLEFERLAPQERRAEVFAMQRTAHAVGIIGASGLLAIASVPIALNMSVGLMALIALWVGIAKAEAVQEY